MLMMVKMFNVSHNRVPSSAPQLWDSPRRWCTKSIPTNDQHDHIQKSMMTISSKWSSMQKKMITQKIDVFLPPLIRLWWLYPTIDHTCKNWMISDPQKLMSHFLRLILSAEKNANDHLNMPKKSPQNWCLRLILSAEKKKAETKRTLANVGKSRWWS